MKRTLTITWTCSEDVTIDIPDYTLNPEEISALILEKADHILPGGLNGPDSWDYEFDGPEPKEIGEGNTPPGDCWVTIEGLKIATNSHELIVEGCPVELINAGLWKNLNGNEKAIRQLENILSVDVDKLPLHTGWFDNSFKNFEGYRVVGNAPQPGITTGCGGYVLDESGNIIAVLMPCLEKGIYDWSRVFQFNKTEAVK